YLHTLVDLLLGHYMLTRGGDRRSAEISDLFTFEFKCEGPTRCMPLIFTTRAGKENQHGHLETISALHYKNPLQPLSYTSQRDWVAKAFEDVGISSSKKTHIGRAAGAKTAELKGVSQEQIRRAGRWNQEQMVGCYHYSVYAPNG
ncbi:hypothetical protein K469DRAFT_555883, partial [Zopfia rhizophila CBS 207.26]